jgi:hypothetical protein
MPAGCAAALMAFAYPASDNGSVSPAARAGGLIAGLRILE